MTENIVVPKFLQYIEDKINLKIVNISKLTNGSYNQVYKLETTDNPLLLRIFSSKTWPEDGKLEFINDKLIKNNVLSSDILVIERDSIYCENGFMLQEFIEGYDVEDIIGDKISHNEYFKKLAKLLRNVHQIELKNCGYIGSGIASHQSCKDFIMCEYEKTKDGLLQKKILNEKQLSECFNIIFNSIFKCDDLPFVLCHNDVAENNVMLNKNGDLILIDWDNAISSNWVADFSVMTFWMYMRYNTNDYESYRKIFIDEYEPKIGYRIIDIMEKGYHLLLCLKLLDYYKDKNNFDMIMDYFMVLMNPYIY